MCKKYTFVISSYLYLPQDFKDYLFNKKLYLHVRYLLTCKIKTTLTTYTKYMLILISLLLLLLFCDFRSFNAIRVALQTLNL